MGNLLNLLGHLSHLGTDKMGYHSFSGTEVGKPPVLASMSFPQFQRKRSLNTHLDVHVKWYFRERKSLQRGLSRSPDASQASHAGTPQNRKS